MGRISAPDPGPEGPYYFEGSGKVLPGPRMSNARKVWRASLAFILANVALAAGVLVVAVLSTLPEWGLALALAVFLVALGTWAIYEMMGDREDPDL